MRSITTSAALVYLLGFSPVMAEPVTLQLMNELIEVGKKRKNEELVRLASRVAAQSLNDIEVAQPTTILIGEYIRQRLSRP